MWTHLQFYPLLLLDHQYKRQYSEKGACLSITKKITFRSQKPPGFHKPHFEKHCSMFYSLFQQKMWNLRRILRWKRLQTSHTWKWFTSLPRQRKMPTVPKSWWDIQRRRTEALWCKALLELYLSEERSCWLQKMHLKRESSPSRKHLHRNASSCPWGILIKGNKNQQWYLIGKKPPWDYY